MFPFLHKAQAQPSMVSPAIAQPIVNTQDKYSMHRISVRVLRRNETLRLMTVEYVDRSITVSYSDVVYDFGNEAWIVSYAVTSQIN